MIDISLVSLLPFELRLRLAHMVLPPRWDIEYDYNNLKYTAPDAGLAIIDRYFDVAMFIEFIHYQAPTDFQVFLPPGQTLARFWALIDWFHRTVSRLYATELPVWPGPTEQW